MKGLILAAGIAPLPGGRPPNLAPSGTPADRGLTPSAWDPVAIASTAARETGAAPIIHHLFEGPGRPVQLALPMPEGQGFGRIG